MKKNIVIIDYGIGNIKSIYNAIDNIGFIPQLTFDAQKILNADSLILPGVGAFAIGMKNLESTGLNDVIKEYVKKGRPLLGICLGMQMLMNSSEEFGLNNGLGLIEGKVVKFPTVSDLNEKIPHVSWNELNEPFSGRWEGTILDGLKSSIETYFVHSYFVGPLNSEDILATTNYAGVDFCSAIQLENIYGTQFHPEKSGAIGLSILNNFINL